MTRARCRHASASHSHRHSRVGRGSTGVLPRTVGSPCMGDARSDNRARDSRSRGVYPTLNSKPSTLHPKT